MQFSTLPILALFAIGALAAPAANTNVEDVEARSLDPRANCGQILPACFGGKVVGQTNCRCKGQKETCDLWTCPGGAPNTVSRLSSVYLYPSLFIMIIPYDYP
jgi:hypothetical protein